jgi:hypothetical protein
VCSVSRRKGTSKGEGGWVAFGGEKLLVVKETRMGVMKRGERRCRGQSGEKASQRRWGGENERARAEGEKNNNVPSGWAQGRHQTHFPQGEITESKLLVVKGGGLFKATRLTRPGQVTGSKVSRCKRGACVSGPGGCTVAPRRCSIPIPILTTLHCNQSSRIYSLPAFEFTTRFISWYTMVSPWPFLSLRCGRPPCWNLNTTDPSSVREQQRRSVVANSLRD